MRERLARRLSTVEAVVVGLGAMLGAGVFAAVAPATAAAGRLVPLGLALAALAAYANATSSAQLAALHPEAGGTYVYARERLGGYWGFLAGWAFVVGKTASLSAMALTFGAYVWPGEARLLAVAVVVAVTGVNLVGVRKTATVTRVLVAVVIGSLVVSVIAMLTGDAVELANLTAGEDLTAGWLGVLRAAGLLFFAFAGYARIATLGEEVRDPVTTIPRAIPQALGITVAIYTVVLVATLASLGPRALAGTTDPVAAAVAAGRWEVTEPVVRVGAAVASASVLLSLLAGVSRTVLAMARRGELPRGLDAVHARYRTPHRAELAAAVLVIAVVAVADLRDAIGFSSFGVLTYYGLANASAWTLAGRERRWPRWLAGLGVVLCAVLALSLPREAVLGGLLLLVVGSFLRAVVARRGAPGM